MTMWLHRKQSPSLKRSILEQKKESATSECLSSLSSPRPYAADSLFLSNDFQLLSVLFTSRMMATDRSESVGSELKKAVKLNSLFAKPLLTVMAGNARGLL